MVLRAVLIAGAVAVAWIYGVSQSIAHDRPLPVSAIVHGAVITQPFGCTTVALEPFDPFCPSRHVHTGVDLAAPAGTTIWSATAGTAHVGYDGAGAGLYVAVDGGGGVRALYCHLFTVAVRSGQYVTAGAPIGTVGASGLATGPHLHLEIQVHGRPVDPLRWLLTGDVGAGRFAV